MQSCSYANKAMLSFSGAIDAFFKPMSLQECRHRRLIKDKARDVQALIQEISPLSLSTIIHISLMHITDSASSMEFLSFLVFVMFISGPDSFHGPADTCCYYHYYKY